MKNTAVDPITNKTTVEILYKPNLPELGENHGGATKRVSTLHRKVYPLPMIPTELDKYIQTQIDQGNYVEIDPEEFRGKYQLHFVAYNFIYSGTSSSETQPQ